MLILNFLKSQSASFAADTATVKVNQSRSFPQWLHDGNVIGSFTKALVEDTSFGAKFAKVACFHIAAWAGSKISSKFRPKMERGSCNAELVPFMAVRLVVWKKKCTGIIFHIWMKCWPNQLRISAMAVNQIQHSMWQIGNQSAERHVGNLESMRHFVDSVHPTTLPG